MDDTTTTTDTDDNEVLFVGGEARDEDDEAEIPDSIISEAGSINPDFKIILTRRRKIPFVIITLFIFALIIMSFSVSFIAMIFIVPFVAAIYASAPCVVIDKWGSEYEQNDKGFEKYMGDYSRAFGDSWTVYRKTVIV